MPIYFYDTCSLLNMQEEAFRSETKFYISSVTLHELENIKTSGNKDEGTKYQARRLLHLLADNEEKYETILFKNEFLNRVAEFDLPATEDTKIISSAYVTFKDRNIWNEGFFVTSDLACKAIAHSLGLKIKFPKREEEENSYSGYLDKQFEDAELAIFYEDALPHNKNIYNLLENQYLLIRDKYNEVIDKYCWTEAGYRGIPFQKLESRMFGKIVAKDPQQTLAIDSLLNNQITMIRGLPGSGKTTISFGFMFSLLEKGQIDKIIIFCNTVAAKGAAKLGYYPGSRTAKLLDSQVGNMLESKLGDSIIVQRYIDEGRLVLLPLSDIRGYDTSGLNAAVYISEAQNLDVELMRLALQRIGEDSICIIDGDFSHQVDSSLYEGSNNGMRRVSEVFRGVPYYGEVELTTVHRSKIAEQAELM